MSLVDDHAYDVLVAERLEAIRERIEAAGGDRSRVVVLAVTKTFGERAVRAALRAGLSEIGENYADELVEKARLVSEDDPNVARWHLIGAVQRRAVARVARFASVFEAVDRLEEGIAIARHRPGATVFVEVDTTGIAGRAGVRPDEVRPLVHSLKALELDVAGLMTVAPPGGGAAAEAAFGLVAALVRDLGLREASMGMTEDLELAVAHGSTEIRVGRGLFGPR